MISEEELWAAKKEAVRALVQARAPGSWPGPIAEPGPRPIFLFFFLSSWKKKSEVKLTGESKATTAFCGLQSRVQTVIVRLCNTVHFCCLLAAAGGRNCSESCWVTGSQEKGCRGRRLCCLPELSLLIFSWAGNTIPYCYLFFFFFNAWIQGQILSGDKSAVLPCSRGRKEDAQQFRIQPAFFGDRSASFPW